MYAIELNQSSQNLIEESTLEILKTGLHKGWLTKLGEEQGKLLVAYMIDCIWENQHRFVYCLTQKQLSFGMRATSLVEGLNKDIKMGRKGVVNKRTLVVDLFKVIHGISSDREKKALHSTRVSDAKQVLAAKSNQAGTIESAARAVTTEYAAMQIIQQHKLLGNYTVEPHSTEPNTFTIINKASTEKETVTVTASSMKCSCNYPLNWLLPCRHVLQANQADKSLQLVMVNQIGERWRRAFMPLAIFLALPVLLPSTSSQPHKSQYQLEIRHFFK